MSSDHDRAREWAALLEGSGGAPPRAERDLTAGLRDALAAAVEEDDRLRWIDHDELIGDIRRDLDLE